MPNARRDVILAFAPFDASIESLAGKPPYPGHTLPVDPLLFEQHRMKRFIFDVSYWVLVPLLLLNMVSGVILDRQEQFTRPSWSGRGLCVCVFIKLHITAQSGPVILVIICHSH